MKILVMNGSPKEQSDTMTLTNAFLQGLNAEGTHEVNVISSFQKNIQFCTGCLSCWFQQDGHCVLQDDMNAILDDMAASDLIIWSFPLHYHGMPASLKAVLDRTIAFMKINMKETDGKVDHEKIIDLSAKKTCCHHGRRISLLPRQLLRTKAAYENGVRSADRGWGLRDRAVECSGPGTPIF